MIEVVPTVVPDSLNKVVTRHARYSTFANTLHIDIADGLFAPNTTWKFDGERKLLGAESFVYEAHLMVQDPEDWIVACADAGFRRVVVHVEALSKFSRVAEVPQKTLSAFREAGIPAIGIGVLFGTPPDAVGSIVGACDFLHLMTIKTIGTQGIPYAKEAPARVAEFHARFPKMLISVDGGVSEENIAGLARAGARRFCVGSALANAEDPAAVYKILQETAENAIQ